MTDQQFNAAMQAAQEKMARGPIVFASVRLGPFGSIGKALVIGFLTQFIAALLATFLLLQTSGNFVRRPRHVHHDNWRDHIPRRSRRRMELVEL
jgi:hypothetical protein